MSTSFIPPGCLFSGESFRILSQQMTPWIRVWCCTSPNQKSVCMFPFGCRCCLWGENSPSGCWLCWCFYELPKAVFTESRCLDYYTRSKTTETLKNHLTLRRLIISQLFRKSIEEVFFKIKLDQALDNKTNRLSQVILWINNKQYRFWKQHDFI